MKRILPFLVLAASGCHQYILINHHYRETGYLVLGLYGRWNWDDVRQTMTLGVGEGFERRFYIDTNNDNLADSVEYQYETFHRGDPGTDELFRRADEDIAKAYGQYDIPEVDKEWREMTPDDRVGYEDYFK